MRNFVLTLFFTGLLSCSLQAQLHQISGKVIDEAGETIPFASIFLLDSSYTTVAKGTAADENGFFSIGEIVPGSYFIKASYIENESEPEILEIAKDLAALEIVLRPNQVLDEVVVVSQQPRFEQKVDRLVFTIANTSLTDGDVWNVLKRTPSVVILQDKIVVKGQDDIKVLINDRPVNLPKEELIDLLSGTSASSVEAIEIITNPPANYSAEGALLINIKMSKNLTARYNGSVFKRFDQGVFPKYTLGTDHYFKGNKTDLSINYSYGSSKKLTRYTDVANFIENGSVASTWTTEQERIRRQNQHSLTAFLDITVDKNNTIGISTINTYAPKVDQMAKSETLIDDPNGNLQRSFNSLNETPGDRSNNSVYLDWTHRTGEKGGTISVNSHYTRYDDSREQVLDTDFFDANGTLTDQDNFVTGTRQKIDLWSLQSDYNVKLDTFWRLTSGLRYAGIYSQSTISQEGFDRDQPGIDPTESGTFDYDENIYAAYLSTNASWTKWKLKMGLRGEFTKTVGQLNTAMETNRRSYFELFPSFSVNFLPSKKNSILLYYYRRINRPRYNLINPFQYFQSVNSVQEGNPNLLPAVRNYVQLGYTFDRSYTIDVFYRVQKNQFRNQVFQDNETNLLRFISTNLIRNISYGADFSINKNFTNRLSSYLTLSGSSYSNRFRDLTSGTIVDNDIVIMTFRTNHTFSFLEDRSLTADLLYFYKTPVIVGNTRQNGYSGLNIGFRKTLWNKKGSFSLEVVDIFNQGNLLDTRQFLDQNNSASIRRENRLLRLAFRYRFGDSGIKNNKKSKKVDEQKRI